MSAPAPLYRPHRLWDELKTFVPPFLWFWGMHLVAFTAFVLAIAWTENFDEEDVLILSCLLTASSAGLIAGQTAAVARVRLPVWGSVAAALIGAAMLAAWSEHELRQIIGKDLSVGVMLGLMVAAWFLPCGWWSLAANTGMMAAFAPTLWVTAVILIVSDELDNDDFWFQGDKWAIWDISTGVVLALYIVAVLILLVLKDRHQMRRWLTAAAGPTAALTRRIKGSPVNFGSCGTVLVGVALTVVLTVTTGVIAPYLWRTGRGDREDDDGHNGPQPEPQPWDGPGEPDPLPDLPSVDGLDAVLERIAEAAEKAVAAGCGMATALILALIGIFVFGPPIRRTLLVQHLRKPLWPVPPTQRAQQAWRLVEIALADAGVHRAPGDSPMVLARRAEVHLAASFYEPVLEAAAVAEKVFYGLGIETDEVRTMQRRAEMAYETVWQRLTEAQKSAAMYRWL